MATWKTQGMDQAGREKEKGVGSGAWPWPELRASAEG